MNQPCIFKGELLVSERVLVGHDSDRGIIDEATDSSKNA